MTCLDQKWKVCTEDSSVGVEYQIIYNVLSTTLLMNSVEFVRDLYKRDGSDGGYGLSA